jgi:hypothetical protein
MPVGVAWVAERDEVDVERVCAAAAESALVPSATATAMAAAKMTSGAIKNPAVRWLALTPGFSISIW